MLLPGDFGRFKENEGLLADKPIQQRFHGGFRQRSGCFYWHIHSKT
jgi:hypothetical protein